MAAVAGALLAAGGCDSSSAPGTWPRLRAAEWAPDQRALVRVDESALVGVWEGDSPGLGWPAPTLTIEQPNVLFCGNSFMESVDGVFYDEQGRATDITPMQLKVTLKRMTGNEPLPDGSTRPVWDTRHYDAYLVELDGEPYLGLAPIYTTPDGVRGYSPHKWHKIEIGAEEIAITWSGAVVSWMAGMTALEDAGGIVAGEPGVEVAPKYRNYVTGSLQRFLEFHQRIAGRGEFWTNRTVWRRAPERPPP